MSNRNFASMVNEIKEQVDPYDFYLSEQNISHFKHGSGDWVEAGLCPFHDDNMPGSFKVNTDIGAFICFSCGQKGGDVIDFIRKKYSLTFLDALYKLKKEWGIRWI